uniref:coiled-coil domain-containing protein 34-like isoform X2 n=1 Tax=Styela clava TaxID=7725 RepID=UPI001939C6C1|nr:coiled-coil domain-containing protein 34-like isoform X2 [Styela clava]
MFSNIFTIQPNAAMSVNLMLIPPPKYASTTRYQQDKPKNLVPSSAPGPSSSPPKRERIIRRTSPLKDCNSHDNTIKLMKMPQEGDRKDLSVWEDWLIKKLQQEREDIKIQMKLQTKIDKREQMLKEEMKVQGKREIERKSKQAYERWVEKRNEIEKEQKEKERRKKLEEKQKEDERRRKNEECFQKWLKKVNEKQCASPRQGTVSEYPAPSYRNSAPWIGPLADKDTKESVRRQHKMMIAEKHATIRQRPKTANQKRKGLVKTGPEKGKGVLICRPATAAPLFYNVPIRNPKNFMPEPKRGSFRGRS